MQKEKLKRAKISVRIPPALKQELMDSMTGDSSFPTLTDFFQSAASAYVLQRRRGEHIRFPVEFVSDQSSDQEKNIRKKA